MPIERPYSAAASISAFAAAGDQRAELAGGFEQLSGLGADHLQVLLFADVGVVHVEQLQHFAFGDDVGGFGDDLHHAHVVERQHHLKCARIQEIADQHRGGIAEQRIGGFSATAHRRFVHDIVVQQRGGMDEFDDGRQLMMGAAVVTVGLGHQ